MEMKATTTAARCTLLLLCQVCACACVYVCSPALCCYIVNLVGLYPDYGLFSQDSSCEHLHNQLHPKQF